MKLTLPNGLVLEGSDTQVFETAKKLGYTTSTTDFYYSESKAQWIKITDMQTQHLRNALLKGYSRWVSDLHSVTDPKELTRKIVNGIDDPNWLALFGEYARRK